MKTLAVKLAQRAGVLLLSPTKSRVDALCDQLREGLLAEGASLEEMLAELRQRRQADDQIIEAQGAETEVDSVAARRSGRHHSCPVGCRCRLASAE